MIKLGIDSVARVRNIKLVKLRIYYLILNRMFSLFYFSIFKQMRKIITLYSYYLLVTTYHHRVGINMYRWLQTYKL